MWGFDFLALGWGGYSIFCFSLLLLKRANVDIFLYSGFKISPQYPGIIYFELSGGVSTFLRFILKYISKKRLLLFLCPWDPRSHRPLITYVIYSQVYNIRGRLSFWAWGGGLVWVQFWVVGTPKCSKS